MVNITSILIVDDSRIARMLTINVVKNTFPNAKILEAESGEKCLQMLEKETPDLILMDINMGGIDGIETSEMIKTANQDQKIIVCSANIQGSIQAQVKELGIKFLSKPINKDKLDATVNEIF